MLPNSTSSDSRIAKTLSISPLPAAESIAIVFSICDRALIISTLRSPSDALLMSEWERGKESNHQVSRLGIRRLCMAAVCTVCVLSEVLRTHRTRSMVPDGASPHFLRWH